jgi:hypothetical protein
MQVRCNSTRLRLNWTRNAGGSCWLYPLDRWDVFLCCWLASCRLARVLLPHSSESRSRLRPGLRSDFAGTADSMRNADCTRQYTFSHRANFSYLSRYQTSTTSSTKIGTRSTADDCGGLWVSVQGNPACARARTVAARAQESCEQMAGVRVDERHACRRAAVGSDVTEPQGFTVGIRRSMRNLRRAAAGRHLISGCLQ